MNLRFQENRNKFSKAATLTLTYFHEETTKGIMVNIVTMVPDMLFVKDTNTLQPYLYLLECSYHINTSNQSDLFCRIHTNHTNIPVHIAECSSLKTRIEAKCMEMNVAMGTIIFLLIKLTPFPPRPFINDGIRYIGPA